MPTYEYHCLDCGDHFTRTEPSYAHAPTERVLCPRCRGRRVEQLLSSAPREEKAGS